MRVDRLFVKRALEMAELNEYLEKELEHTGYGGMSLSRVPTGTRITLYVERPGAVIGKKGKSVQELTEELARRFKLENPQIEVVGIEKPELNASIMAKRIAFALERGAHYRSLGYTFMNRIMEAGARGVEIVLSGKLGGDRAKKVRFYQGYLSKAGEPAHRLVSYGFAYAKLRPGVVGVKVRIMPPVPTPDEIRIKTEVQEKETGREVAEAEGGRDKEHEQGRGPEQAQGAEGGAGQGEGREEGGNPSGEPDEGEGAQEGHSKDFNGVEGERGVRAP